MFFSIILTYLELVLTEKYIALNACVISANNKIEQMKFIISSVQFSHSVVSNSATPWTAAHKTSLSITNSCSLLKLMSIVSVMPSNHLILCSPLLLPSSIFPSIKVFSRVSCLHWVARELEFQLPHQSFQ